MLETDQFVLITKWITFINNEETIVRTPSTDEPEVITISSEFEAQISKKAATGYDDNTGQRNPRVQFERIQEETTESGQIEQLITAEDKKIRRYHKHDHKRHHHKSRKYSLQEDPQWRKRSGAGLPDTSGVLGRRVSVQPDEASTLQELDIEDLESHRSDDPRGRRRHKNSLIQIGRKKEGGIPHDAFKKMYDHSPHEVFVQLDELFGVGERMVRNSKMDEI